jgi:protein involved in polysaccharide export with SLBB domain
MLVFKPYIFTFFGLLLLQGFVFAQTPSETPSNPDAESSQIIHFGDLIDVDVVGSAEYDWRGTITPEGFLSGIGFIDEPIYALCQTEETIARKIEKAYDKLLRAPKVVVRVLDRSGRPVSVLYGAVKTPQRFQIQRSVRLNELIILSGGITERASGEIQIFRPQYLSCQEEKKSDENKTAVEGENRTSFVSTRREDNGSTYINIKITDLLAGKTEANPLILTGDIVTILEASPIYIIGGVASPKQISSRSRMTIARAIATAGGLTKDADPKKILIFRRNGRESKTIEVDLDAVKAEKAEDIVLQAFDIVDVPQKGKTKRKFPPVIRSIDGDDKNALNLPLRIVE